MERADYVIVGAGLTGCVIARRLADAGRDVVVLERKPHVGGNVRDYLHPSGVRIHAHGPHYFRTSSDRVWRFVTKYAKFFNLAAKVLTLGPSGLVPWPVRRSYLSDTYGHDWAPGFSGCPRNFEEAVLARMPTRAYRTLIQPYTEKQWGVGGRQLNISLAKRVFVRSDDDERLTPRAKYQGLPCDGYAGLIDRMLGGIPVRLDCGFSKQESGAHAKRLLVFTGSIDEFFGCALGRLRYRAQERRSECLEGVALAQPCVQINNPLHSEGPHIRTIEWKHLMPNANRQQILGSVCTREYPYTAATSLEYEYPFPDESNRRLYNAYRSQARTLDGVVICGRLGEYRYLDMDQAIGRALIIADGMLRERGCGLDRARVSPVLRQNKHVQRRCRYGQQSHVK